MIGAGTSARKCEKRGFMPIAIFDSDTIPRDRRPEPEAAVVAAGRHLSKRFEGSDRRRPGPPEVRGVDHVIPRGGYFHPVRVERDSGRGDRARARGDGRLRLFVACER